tara:strand:- start:660 stop:1412 length:753 start_codon:yes stop_codon:yes gene_type:complete
MKKRINLIIFFTIFFWALVDTDVSLMKFIKGLTDIKFFLIEMWPPNFSELNAVFPDFLISLKMAFFATFLGSLLAYPIAILASKTTTKNNPLNYFFRFFLNVIRTIPDLLLAALCVALFGASPFAGAIALTLFSFGIISKLLYESLDSMNEESLNAITSVGGSWISRIKYSASPIILPQFLSYCLYVFEINIRAAAIIGLVGAGGIGVWLNINFDLGQYQKISSLLLAIFLVVTIVDYISEKIRKRLMKT